MNMFLADASTWGSLIMIVVLLVVFYFFMIRPQKKQEKETQNMRNGLSVGDEIVTIGGIVGTIVSIGGDEFITIVSSREKSRIQLLKTSVSRVLVPANAPEEAAPEKK